MVSGINSALTGALAFQRKVDTTSNNIANATTRDFKHSRVLMEETGRGGVTTRVEKVDTPGPQVLEPGPEGPEVVEQSNVDLNREIPELILGQRGYEANLKTLATEDEMLGTLLDLVD